MCTCFLYCRVSRQVYFVSPSVTYSVSKGITGPHNNKRFPAQPEALKEHKEKLPKNLIYKVKGRTLGRGYWESCSGTSCFQLQYATVSHCVKIWHCNCSFGPDSWRVWRVNMFLCHEYVEEAVELWGGFHLPADCECITLMYTLWGVPQALCPGPEPASHKGFSAQRASTLRDHKAQQTSQLLSPL